ncbi:hypothetical protein BKA70DRAFT_346014 [Coprinopsis sp. MPI-PUGE-AT-0042]|nr:hypothetical protein BKA70DRAFT_346014 [Coprinopsis sp. MPI-PUGE-AT-0042]
MPFRCYRSICFNHLRRSPPIIHLRPSLLSRNLRPCKPCNSTAHTSAFEVPGPTCDDKYQASHPPPPVMVSILEQMENQDVTMHTTHPLPLDCRLALASATVGHLLHVSDLDIVAVGQGLIQHHRRHHMACRAAVLSILDGPLNFRHFHVMAPGAPATGDWMDVWRDFVSAEWQTKGFGSNGDWECRVLPGRSLSLYSNLDIRKST